MSKKLVTVFGGNGFVGRHIVQRLTAAGHRVRVACRDPETAIFLKPLGDPGQIVPIKANVCREDEVARAVKGADWVVNCAGILTAHGRNSFANVHEVGSATVAREAKAAGATALVHFSALCADENASSKYAQTKARGETAVREAYPDATILKSSIIIGSEDGFFNRFAAIARWSPVVPIIGCPIMPTFKTKPKTNGKWRIPSLQFCDFAGTRFQPVFVGDAAQACVNALNQDSAKGEVFEITGPRVYTFRALMELMLNETRRSRMVVPYPVPMAYATAFFAEMIPGKPFSRDMVYMLKTTNILTGAQKTIKDLGVNPSGIEAILPTYLQSYRSPSKRRLRLGRA